MEAIKQRVIQRQEHHRQKAQFDEALKDLANLSGDVENAMFAHSLISYHFAHGQISETSLLNRLTGRCARPMSKKEAKAAVTLLVDIRGDWFRVDPTIGCPEEGFYMVQCRGEPAAAMNRLQAMLLKLGQERKRITALGPQAFDVEKKAGVVSQEKSVSLEQTPAAQAVEMRAQESCLPAAAAPPAAPPTVPAPVPSAVAPSSPGRIIQTHPCLTLTDAAAEAQVPKAEVSSAAVSAPGTESSRGAVIFPASVAPPHAISRIAGKAGAKPTVGDEAQKPAVQAAVAVAAKSAAKRVAVLEAAPKSDHRTKVAATSPARAAQSGKAKRGRAKGGC